MKKYCFFYRLVRLHSDKFLSIRIFIKIKKINQSLKKYKDNKKIDVRNKVSSVTTSNKKKLKKAQSMIETTTNQNSDDTSSTGIQFTNEF